MAHELFHDRVAPLFNLQLVIVIQAWPHKVVVLGHLSEGLNDVQGRQVRRQLLQAVNLFFDGFSNLHEELVFQSG